MPMGSRDRQISVQGGTVQTWLLGPDTSLILMLERRLQTRCTSGRVTSKALCRGVRFRRGFWARTPAWSLCKSWAGVSSKPACTMQPPKTSCSGLQACSKQRCKALQRPVSKHNRIVMGGGGFYLTLNPFLAWIVMMQREVGTARTGWSAAGGVCAGADLA